MNQNDKKGDVKNIKTEFPIVDFNKLEIFRTFEIFDDDSSRFLCHIHIGRHVKGHYEYWLTDHRDNYDRLLQQNGIPQCLAVPFKTGSFLENEVDGVDSAKFSQVLHRADANDSIRQLLEKLKVNEDNEFSVDLTNDLKELACCLDVNVYRGALSLCGRLLELSLKVLLNRNAIQYDNDWMIGKLLSLVEENGLYSDPALKNVFNIINKNRIVGVHAKERVPIPSKNQVLSVVYAVCDTVDRCVLSDGGERSK